MKKFEADPDRSREKTGSENLRKYHIKRKNLYNAPKNDLLRFVRMKLSFMCVKHKCNIYFKKYDNLVICFRFYASSPIILADFLLRETGSGRLK